MTKIQLGDDDALSHPIGFSVRNTEYLFTVVTEIDISDTRLDTLHQHLFDLFFAVGANGTLVSDFSNLYVHLTLWVFDAFYG